MSSREGVKRERRGFGDEGSQICTKARELQSEIVRGKDFVAVKLWYMTLDPKIVSEA